MLLLLLTMMMMMLSCQFQRHHFPPAAAADFRTIPPLPTARPPAFSPYIPAAAVAHGRLQCFIHTSSKCIDELQVSLI